MVIVAIVYDPLQLSIKAPQTPRTGVTLPPQPKLVRLLHL